MSDEWHFLLGAGRGPVWQKPRGKVIGYDTADACREQISRDLQATLRFFCCYWSVVDLQFVLISAVQQSDSVIHIYTFF